jgi:lipoprotein
MKRFYVWLMVVLFIVGCVFCYVIFSTINDDKPISVSPTDNTISSKTEEPVNESIVSSSVDSNIKIDDILLQSFDFKYYSENIDAYVKAVENYTSQLGDIQYNITLSPSFIEIMFNGEVGASIKFYLKSGINKDTRVVISNQQGYSVNKKLGDIMVSNSITKVSSINDLIELAPDLVQYVSEG